MKQLFFTLLFFTYCFTYGQSPEGLIPKDAVTVLSINNLNLLQKISLDELIKYDFMVDFQQELFDGSTQGKTIKESGINFNKNFSVFYGKTYDYNISGFTFTIENQTKFFAAFDDFQQEKSNYDGIQIYSSYLNKLILKGADALFISVTPLHNNINDIADSVWFSRGNTYYNNMYQPEVIEPVEDNISEIEVEEEIHQQEMLGEQFEGDTFNDPVLDLVSGKTYWEIRDSISYVLNNQFLKEVLDQTFIEKQTLMSVDSRFANQLNNKSEGIFYLDNSRNLKKNRTFWYLKKTFPNLHHELSKIYTGNVILGTINLNDNNIDFKLKANYGGTLGKVYEEMNGSKLDKNVFRYIHKDAPAFFTYKVDLEKAYEQAYQTFIPLLENENDKNIETGLLVLDIINEYIDQESVFDSFEGTVFGTFDGIEKVKTKRIEYQYDEETFEYAEKEVTAEEEMPIFTFGISTAKQAFISKIMRRLTRINEGLLDKGGYWMVENALLGTAPIYFINRNNLFVITNNHQLVTNHLDGFEERMSPKKIREIKSNGFIYAELDWSKTIDNLPRDIFNGKQNEILDSMRGKGGFLKLTSGKTTAQSTNFQLIYEFEANTETHILDFINNIYLISK